MQPNGSVTSYTYDALERFTGVGNRKADASLISGYNYGLNTRDVRTWVESQVGSNPLQHVNYSYDDVDQLIGEASTETPVPQLNHQLSYDAMGNRSQEQSGTLPNQTQSSYTSNRLNQISNFTRTPAGGTPTITNLSYDLSGNLTSQSNQGNPGGTSYVYDEADRLIRITQTDPATGVNQHQSEFVYDGLSRKVISREYSWDAPAAAWVLDAGSEKRRIYDGMDVVQERDGSNVTTCNYTRDGNIGGLLARTVKVAGQPDTHSYYHYDGSGNVVQLTDANQAVVAQYSYDAYGNTLSISGSQSGQPYRFSTKEQHAYSGLYDYGFRFYSPALGRFINRDPIAESGGLNLYGFVQNNPVNNGDEYGESVGSVAGTIGVGIGIITIPEWGPPVFIGGVAGAALGWCASKAYEWWNRPRIDQATDSSKNERHGAGDRAIDKVAEQLERLRKELAEATERAEKVKIRTKIRRIEEAARQAKKGTEDTRRGKRN